MSTLFPIRLLSQAAEPQLLRDWLDPEWEWMLTIPAHHFTGSPQWYLFCDFRKNILLAQLSPRQRMTPTYVPKIQWEDIE